MFIYSLIRTFGCAESRLHLRKTQKNLVFHSVCTTFAPEIITKSHQDMNLRKMACLTGLLLMAASVSAADNWIDVTKQHVTNPAFDGDSSEGWAWDSNASTQAVRVECISFYSGYFNLYQTLKRLPSGHYRLSVQGFYRTSDNDAAYSAHKNGSENITAFLYAGETQKPLVSLYSASMDHNAANRCWERDGKFYPDGKEAAKAAFEEGLYWNSIEFDFDGRNLTIGVACNEYNNNNYCVLDNFKLEYSGNSEDGGKMWIDLTDRVLTNTTFDNNDQSGWFWDSDASSQKARCECMEFWSGYFNIWQTVKDLPKGKYRLSVQALYRLGDDNWACDDYKSGNDYMPAVMFAGDSEQKLLNIYSESLSYDVGGCYKNDGKYYPTSMEAARIFFDRDMYWNTMEFEAEGTINIGLRCFDAYYSNWCIFDNFILEYYGELVKVSSVEVTAEKKELIVGEYMKLTPNVQPVNATMAWVTWASDNEKAITVDNDGVVRAVGEGTATITATAIDGSGVKGSITITARRNQAKPGSLIINEIMASNVDEFVSPAFNFDGFVELYNPTDLPVEIEGLEISDPINGEGPWRVPAGASIIPAKGFGTIWFDSNDGFEWNAPFKLDVDGGSIRIADATGNILAEENYPAGMERVSYARTQDGTGEWGLTGYATPNESNSGAAFATEQLQAPVVDQPSKLFTGMVAVKVTIPAGCTLRYTTDGSLPTLTYGETSSTGRFNVKETTCFRFRLFADGKLPSRVTTRSYILNDMGYTLPVLSVVTDWDFLYNTEIGVMTTGPNGRPGNGQDANCNWNMNWERPVNFSLLNADGEMVFNQDANLEMCGGWSRAWTPHAFKLKGSKELGGDKNLLYPFFDQKPYIRNRTLQVRNGGNDNYGRFKDPSIQYMIQTSGLNIDCQSYQPVHEFINDWYVGVLNIREPNNKHYVYANYGWDEDEIDQFEMSPDSGYVQKCGTPDIYNELVDVLSPNAADANTYAEICRRLDIDAYANYMAVQFYLGNWDWPQNNVKGFRHRDNGKFRFVLFDLDGAFNTNDPFNTFFNKETYTFDQLKPASLGRIRDKIRFVTLFKNLLKNKDFCRRFVDAYCIVGGSVLEKTRVTQIVEELLNRVEPAMNIGWESASSSANSVMNGLKNRLTDATSALKNYAAFGVKNTTTQSVTLNSDTEGATLFINEQKIPTGRFTGRLFAPVKLRAQAPAGYVFQGWLTTAGTVRFTDEEITMPTGNVNLKASFRAMTDAERQDAGVTPVRINEISGANDCFIDENGKKGDWVELYNTTNEPIDVEGMYLTDNLNKPEKYQITKGNTKANTIIPAHGYLIIWCDKRETSDRGLHASFKISDDGGSMALMAADKSWKDVMDYCAHDSKVTVGRFPDGNADVYKMDVPTIAASNVKTSYVTEVEQTGGQTDIRTATQDNNGLNLCYGSGQLVLSAAAEQATVSVYTVGGQLVEEAVVTFTGGSAHLDVSHLQSGFYVARAVDNNGAQVSCKFMK